MEQQARTLALFEVSLRACETKFTFAMRWPDPILLTQAQWDILENGEITHCGGFDYVPWPEVECRFGSHKRQPTKEEIEFEAKVQELREKQAIEDKKLENFFKTHKPVKVKDKIDFLPVPPYEETNHWRQNVWEAEDPC